MSESCIIRVKFLSWSAFCKPLYAAGVSGSVGGSGVGSTGGSGVGSTGGSGVGSGVGAGVAVGAKVGVASAVGDAVGSSLGDGLGSMLGSMLGNGVAVALVFAMCSDPPSHVLGMLFCEYQPFAMCTQFGPGRRPLSRQ